MDGLPDEIHRALLHQAYPLNWICGQLGYADLDMRPGYAGTAITPRSGLKAAGAPDGVSVIPGHYYGECDHVFTSHKYSKPLTIELRRKMFILTSTVTAVTAGAPWRFARPIY